MLDDIVKDVLLWKDSGLVQGVSIDAARLGLMMSDDHIELAQHLADNIL